MAEHGYCQYEQCDREAPQPVLGRPEARFRLCALHQPLVHDRLTVEAYRWQLVDHDGRVAFVEKIPWNTIHQ